jgi:hypothetical protein
MSYSTDPVEDAAVHYDKIFSEAEAADKAEGDLALDFLAACRKCDSNALARFAPMVNDYQSAFVPMPKRMQTMTEVLEESLDYDGPTTSEVMQLLLNVAYGTDVVNAPEQARDLLNRMAATFAKFNVGEV